MTKDEAIKIIDALYPIDSEFEETNVVGEELLAEAKFRVGQLIDWRDEPTKVLVKYAQLCQQYDQLTCQKVREPFAIL